MNTELEEIKTIVVRRNRKKEKWLEKMTVVDENGKKETWYQVCCADGTAPGKIDQWNGQTKNFTLALKHYAER